MNFKPAERENRQKKKPDSSEWTALPGYYEECVDTPTLSGQAINALEPEGDTRPLQQFQQNYFWVVSQNRTRFYGVGRKEERR